MEKKFNNLDLIKAIATQAIVLHHFSNYGQLSEIIKSFSFILYQLFFEYGRMFVQSFLVISGFLIAHKTNHTPNIFQEIKKRYLRLCVPMFIAVFFILCLTYILRQFNYNSEFLPTINSSLQLLSHLFLTYNIFDQEALSIGIWYVSIDIQLFIFTLFLSKIIPYKYFNKAILIIMGCSLLFFNLEPNFDKFFIYFFFAYGLGIITYNNNSKEMFVALILAAIGLFLFFRERIIFSISTAFVILFFNKKLTDNSIFKFFINNSYSLFLTHFFVIILFDFLVSKGYSPFSIYTILFAYFIAQINSFIFQKYIIDNYQHYIDKFAYHLKLKFKFLKT